MCQKLIYSYQVIPLMTALLRICHIISKFCPMDLVGPVISSSTKNLFRSVCKTCLIKLSHMSDIGHISIRRYNSSLSIYSDVIFMITQVFVLHQDVLVPISKSIFEDVKCHIYETRNMTESRFLRIAYNFFSIGYSYTYIFTVGSFWKSFAEYVSHKINKNLRNQCAFSIKTLF